MNVLFLGFVVWWSYNSFGLMGVLGFPLMSESRTRRCAAWRPLRAVEPPAEPVRVALAPARAAVFGMLYFRQNGMLYVNAMKSYQALPPQFNMPDYEDVWITTEDGVRIFAWFIRAKSNSRQAPTLMFFHGNSGTIAERHPNAEGLIKHANCNVLLVEYRGYGTSQGEPSEAGLKADAQGALDHLLGRTDIDTENLFVFGRSLGGAVAIHLAHSNEGALRGVLVENTFTCIREMGAALFPFLKALPTDWLEALLENKWHSDELIGQLKLPCLFLAGKQDEIVPAPQMVELWDRLGGTGKEHPSGSVFVPFPLGKHNDTWTLPGYYAPVARFIRSTAKPGSCLTGGAAAAPAPGLTPAPASTEEKKDADDDWDPTEILTRGAIEGLTVAELRKALKVRKVEHSHCVEKRELVALLQRYQSGGSGPLEAPID